MIDLASRVKSDNLTQKLLDYITGDLDGVPKDPLFALKLYMSLSNISAVGRIAITIA